MTIKELNKLIKHFNYAGDKDKVERLEELKKQLYSDKVEQAKARNHEYKYERTDFAKLDEVNEQGGFVISGKYLNIYLKMAQDKGEADKVTLIKAEQKRRTRQAREAYNHAKFEAEANELFAQLFND